MRSTSEHNRLNNTKWNRRSRTYDKGRFHYFRYMQKKVISQAKIGKEANFLDLGCGTGWAVRYVANLLQGKGTFIGIDISPGMIEKAKENSIGLKNISFIQASAEDIPLGNNFFTIIICTNSFHHYLHPQKVLGEVRKVLKEKGRLYILDVTADDFFTKWIDVRIRKKEKEHVQFYSTKHYNKMFSEVGLKYIDRKIIAYPMKLHIGEK